MNYGADDYAHMARARALAFKHIADQLGKDHKITKMMGALAWGRYSREPNPSAGLRAYVEAKGFLDGVFDVLNLWARDNDGMAQRIMLDEYPRAYSKAPGSDK